MAALDEELEEVRRHLELDVLAAANKLFEAGRAVAESSNSRAPRRAALPTFTTCSAGTDGRKPISMASSRLR